MKVYEFRLIIFGCAFAISCSVGSLSYAQIDERYVNVPVKYDRNGNGNLDRGSELEVYLIHQRNPVLAKFDIDLNGELSGGEVIKMNKAARERLDDDLLDVEDYLEIKPDGITVVEGPSANTPKPSVRTNQVTSGFFIRNAYTTVSVLSEVPRQDTGSLRTSTPATLAYTRDNQADSDQLAISGSTFGFRRWSFQKENKPLRNLQAAALSGGVVFDRTISSAEDANEADSLALRINGDAVFNRWPVFNDHYLTLSTMLTSDFDFDSALLTGGIRWQPVHNPWAIGGVAREFEIANSALAFRWQPSIDIEYQRVVDDGGQAQLQEADDFLFVGPLFSAQLFFDFAPFNGAFLNMDYRLMVDALGNAGSFNFIEASANFPLDSTNHYLLNFRFRDGNLPTTRQEVDDSLIGIGVRF